MQCPKTPASPPRSAPPAGTLTLLELVSSWNRRSVNAELNIAAEALLTRSERRVDILVGPRPPLPSGLKFDPALLTAAQRAALSRATCAAAEHELVYGRETLAGQPEALPDDFAVFMRGSRTPTRALEELAGTGLVTASGTVAA